MTFQLRKTIASKILNNLTKCDAIQNSITEKQLAYMLRYTEPAAKSPLKDIEGHPHFKLQLSNILKVSTLENTENVQKQFLADKNFFEYVEVKDNVLYTRIKHMPFYKHVLPAVGQSGSNYGFCPEFHSYSADTKGKLSGKPQKEKVIVEYSSPNIAKPFHAGHLRSTILGNFIANLNEKLGHDVIRINFLGDWGTQFGLLGVGFGEYGSKEKLEKDAVKHLYEVYVAVNKAAMYDSRLPEHEREHIADRARDFFRKMEEGDEESLAFWREIRDYSLKDLQRTYERIGIRFDVFEGEEMFKDDAFKLIDRLRNMGLYGVQKATGVGVVDISDERHKQFVQLLKSDGTTLYATRDLAAILARFEKYKFDRIHYVVDTGQSNHFKGLCKILQKMGYTWADNIHVAFGRIIGMSTRMGGVTFLEDVLDEARDNMIRKLEEAETTKIHPDDFEETAEALGMSAVIVQDFRAKRRKDYKFSWEKTLDLKENSGLGLMYTYARLNSLERLYPNIKFPDPEKVDFSYIQQQEAKKLIHHIAGFEDVIAKAFYDYEPSVIVTYLMTLVSYTNKAYKKMQIKDQKFEIQLAYLYMFHCAKIVLENGLNLLGTKPVKQM